MLAKFSGLNPKEPYVSLENARAKMFFCNLNLLFLCCSPSPLQNLPIVVIQKFCYHGNVTSHFSSLFLPLFQAVFLGMLRFSPPLKNQHL